MNKIDLSGYIQAAAIGAILSAAVMFAAFSYGRIKNIEKNDPRNAHSILIKHDDGYSSIVFCSEGFDLPTEIDLNAGLLLSTCPHDAMIIVQQKTETITLRK